MAAARRDQPGEHEGNRVGDVREPPDLRDREPAAREWPRRLVHTIDVQVVDLVERVVPGVEQRRHRRSKQRWNQQARRPRLARRGADRGERSRHESEGGRDQGEGARQVDVRAQGNEFGVRRSAFGVHGFCGFCGFWVLGSGFWVLGSGVLVLRSVLGSHASQSATAAATLVLMKFKRSLFTMAGASSVAPRALSTTAPAVAATTTVMIADAGISAPATPTAASPNAAIIPAAVPSSDIAPGVPALTRPNDVIRNVDRPHALPISLATVSLPPAASDA